MQQNTLQKAKKNIKMLSGIIAYTIKRTTIMTITDTPPPNRTAHARRARRVQRVTFSHAKYLNAVITAVFLVGSLACIVVTVLTILEATK